MRKQYKIDSINVPKTETKTFKQKASNTALKGYVILTLLGAYTAAVFYAGMQYQGKPQAEVVKIPTAVASVPK